MNPWKEIQPLRKVKIFQLLFSLELSNIQTTFGSQFYSNSIPTWFYSQLLIGNPIAKNLKETTS